MRKHWTTLLLVAALCAAGTRSLADTITVNLNYHGGAISYTTNPALSSNPNGGTGGLFSLLQTAANPDPLPYTFTQSPIGAPYGAVGIAAFCIDLLQTVNSTNNNFAIIDVQDAPKGAGQSGMGAARANAIAALWRGSINPAQDANLPNLAKAHYNAAQLAIWKIVYEADPTKIFDLSDGSFTANTNTYALGVMAQAMLQQAEQDDLAGNRASLLALSSPITGGGGIQDLIVEVPEAANIISLAAIGLVAGLFNIKRFRRKMAT